MVDGSRLCGLQVCASGRRTASCTEHVERNTWLQVMLLSRGRSLDEKGWVKWLD